MLLYFLCAILIAIERNVCMSAWVLRCLKYKVGWLVGRQDPFIQNSLTVDDFYVDIEFKTGNSCRWRLYSLFMKNIIWKIVLVSDYVEYVIYICNTTIFFGTTVLIHSSDYITELLLNSIMVESKIYSCGIE